VVDRVASERDRIATADDATKAKIADLIGLTVYPIKSSNGHKVIGATCFPSLLADRYLGKTFKEQIVLKIVKCGKGNYQRKTPGK